jgi:NAD(P)H-dependent FMN reductase
VTVETTWVIRWRRSLPIYGIPLYDGDLEASGGIPQSVTKLKQAIATADGLLLATPEYNNSIPGVFKNAIDWLSRPPADFQAIFGGKPVVLIGASHQAASAPFSARTLGSPFCARLVPSSGLRGEFSYPVRRAPSTKLGR